MVMMLRIEYKYDHISGDQILLLMKEFEEKLLHLDKKALCTNFQIKSCEGY